MESASNQHAIIVAGGKGLRMNSTTPKQFLELNGLPVLMHTINTFSNYSPSINIILVLPEKDISAWKALCLKHKFTKPLRIAAGGNSRFQSVKKGLDKISDKEGFVAIHDGVRPLVRLKTISESFQAAAIHKAAIAAVPLKESIRLVDQDSSKAVDRSKYRLIQTPQTFALSLIKKAYEVQETPELTDDASVAERAGYKVWLFDGSYENIKITTPEDFVVAETLLNNIENKG